MKNVISRGWAAGLLTLSLCTFGGALVAVVSAAPMFARPDCPDCNEVLSCPGSLCDCNFDTQHQKYLCKKPGA